MSEEGKLKKQFSFDLEYAKKLYPKWTNEAELFRILKKHITNIDEAKKDFQSFLEINRIIEVGLSNRGLMMKVNLLYDIIEEQQGKLEKWFGT